MSRPFRGKTKKAYHNPPPVSSGISEIGLKPRTRRKHTFIAEDMISSVFIAETQRRAQRRRYFAEIYQNISKTKLCVSAIKIQALTLARTISSCERCVKARSEREDCYAKLCATIRD